MEDILFFLEIMGTVAFAISGAVLGIRKRTFRKNRFLASDGLRHHGADPHQRETDNHADHGLFQMFPGTEHMRCQFREYDI